MSTSVASLTTNYFPTAQNGFTTTTAGSVASGAATVTLNSVAGYTNGKVVVLVIDPTDAAKKQTFTGIVDTAGVQITSVVWTAGTNQTHALGATVVDYETATHWNMIEKGITQEHGQGGTHTNITQADANYIKDDAGNELLKWSKTASAVNEVTIKNAATGGSPIIKASGGDSAVSLNLQGKGLAKTVTIGAGATPIFPYDYVVSGCVWSGDAYASTRNASMTAGVVVINGNSVTVAAVTARSFTASKDVYVDVLDNGDGTGLLVYTDNTTNAASPALASNSVRIAIIVVGATNIVSAASVNQGQEDKVVPIASSIPYAVTDSLGNLICPRDPNRKVLGYRQITSTFSSSTIAGVDVTGLSVPFIAIDGRKVKATLFSSGQLKTGSAGDVINVNIQESGTNIAFHQYNMAGSNYVIPANVVGVKTPTAGLHTYKANISATGAGTMQLSASTGAPAFILVELV